MYELYDTEAYTKMGDIAYLGTFKTTAKLNKFIEEYEFEGEPHIIRPDKLDHYLVKSAHSKNWQRSSENNSISAARELFKERNVEVNKYYYVHVKHEYDNYIEKYGLRKEMVIHTYIVP